MIRLLFKKTKYRKRFKEFEINYMSKKFTLRASRLERICYVASHSRKIYYSVASCALQMRPNQLVKYPGEQP